MGVKLGDDMKLYMITGGGPRTTTIPLSLWTEIGNVRDLTLNQEKGEADVTTRGNNGYEAMIGTLKKASADFQTVYDTSDALFNLLSDAYHNGTAIGLAIVDGNIATSGTKGLIADFSITKFNLPQPLEDAVKVDVTAKVTYSTNDPVWYTVP